MTSYRIVIGNYNYSSWSLRGWLPLYLLKMHGLIDDFDVTMVDLKAPARKQAIIAAGGGSVKVPVLFDGQQAIWESSVIIEYLAEKHPEANIYPDIQDALWWGKVIAQEMHGGFAPLRKACPMDLMLTTDKFEADEDVLADVMIDVQRINDLWQESLNRFGGKFLLGDDFSFADMMFAPIVTRFISYQLPSPHQEYMNNVREHPAMQVWYNLAKIEMEQPDVLSR